MMHEGTLETRQAAMKERHRTAKAKPRERTPRSSFARPVKKPLQKLGFDEAVISLKLAPPDSTFDTIGIKQFLDPLVYVFLSKDGEVLYVGSSRRGVSRPFQHGHNAAEARRRAASVHLYSCSSHYAALKLESELIQLTSPAFNIAKNSEKLAAKKVQERFWEVLGNKEPINAEPRVRVYHPVGSLERPTVNDPAFTYLDSQPQAGG